jgi:hypothetical protein
MPGQPGSDEAECNGADGQIDVEDPAPGQGVGQIAAEKRAGDAADREYAGEQSLIAAALARRYQVADRRLRQ